MGPHPTSIDDGDISARLTDRAMLADRADFESRQRATNPPGTAAAGQRDQRDQALPRASGRAPEPDATAVATLGARTGRVVSANDAFVAAVGAVLSDVIGRRLHDLIELPLLGEHDRRRLDDAFGDGIPCEIETTWIRHGPRGVAPAWCEVRASGLAMGPSPEPTHVVITLRDVDELHRVHDRLSHAAHHDDLTTLPNRAYTLRRLSSVLSDCNGTNDRVTVFFVDLDHFKLVNDTLGHAAGDVVLRGFAERLRRCARPDDVIGRFGGDEFVVVSRHAADETSDLSDRLLAAMREPIRLAEGDLHVSCSVGAATSEAVEVSPDRLMQAADTALFEAKRLGRGRCELFTPELHRRLIDRVELEAELRTAIASDQLLLEYQPQIDLYTGRVVGVEALVRWQHPRRGLLGPAAFVPLAEECGLIGTLGSWVLEHACRQLAMWRHTGAGPRQVTVNVSPLQLDGRDLVDELRGSLRRYALEPKAISLEVTESGLMSHATAVETLADLRSLGCYIGIDDFGTGHSSLARLRELPVEVLKIDRSFVDGLGTDPNDSAIVSSIMSLAFTMGLHVIAEGVEHPRQAEALVRLGCQYAQGYLFARPQPAHLIPALMPRRLWKPLSGESAASDGIGGPVVDARAARRGHRRFIHEFLDQIGVPMLTDSASAPGGVPPFAESGGRS